MTSVAAASVINDQSGSSQSRRGTTLPDLEMGASEKDQSSHEMVNVERQQELVGNTTQQRNWRGIAIALVVILVVLALIIMAIFLLSEAEPTDDNRAKFSFQDFIEGESRPKEFYPRWLNDEDGFLYRNNDGAVVSYNCSSNNSSILMDNTTFREYNTDSYYVSADKQYVLLMYDVEMVYRHSKFAKFSYYNVNNKEVTKISTKYGSVFQHVSWSPTDHGAIFVQENNLFYKKDITDDEEPQQLTIEGYPHEIYCGIPDWIYEEEVLSSDRAFWWSPQGTYIIYAVFNDTEVPRYYYPIYGPMNDVYGIPQRIPYPKPGYRNPTFKLVIRNMLTNHSEVIKPPKDFMKKDHYFTFVAWRDDNFVVISWLNRSQNESIITICNAEMGACQVNQRESSRDGWVEMSKVPIFTPKGDKYFLILPSQEGDNGYFKHVAMVKLPVSTSTPTKLSNKEGVRHILTHGQYDVTDIVGYNPTQEKVYYISTNEDPRQRHLFSVTSSLEHKRFRNRQCITCNLDKKCQYYTASFSQSGAYYVLGCKGPGVPYYTLRSTETDMEIMMESNEWFKQWMKGVALPKVEYLKIPNPNSKEFPYMYGKILIPAKIKMKEILTYPLLINVYGGPNSQQVTNAFSLGWETYLASTHNFVCAFVDGRGSAARGNRFLHEIYKKLGQPEVTDTLTAGDYYNKLKYVDATKTAIWGWSYGGFLAAHALGRGTDTFRCGMSVAPVTDFRYYDSIYTERYMLTPEENPDGYNLSNVSRNARNFKNSKYLLIHGTGDDNVHFQNSAQLMRALVEENVYFRSQIYTDQQHGIDGGNSRRHLYETMEDFLKECFTGKSSKFDLHHTPKVEE